MTGRRTEGIKGLCSDFTSFLLMKNENWTTLKKNKGESQGAKMPRFFQHDDDNDDDSDDNGDLQ